MVQNKIELVTTQDKELLEGLLLSAPGSMTIPFLGKQVGGLWPVHVLFYCGLIHVLLLLLCLLLKNCLLFQSHPTRTLMWRLKVAGKKAEGLAKTSKKLLVQPRFGF